MWAVGVAAFVLLPLGASVAAEAEVADLRRAAENGSASAQYNLGLRYYEGNGVPKDAVQAARWYALAAAQGYRQAQNNLGTLYNAGEGVPKDRAAAMMWFTRAAEQGLAEAQANLGVLHRDAADRNMPEAVKWFTRAAEQGNADAQYELGLIYDLADGVPRDVARAVTWYTLAAEQGDAPAQNNLGLLHANGDGVPRNMTEAVKWFTRAAEQGSASAQQSLAAAYLSGNGVPKDAALAIKWLTPLAGNGDVNAQYNLAVLHDAGEGVPRNEAEAIKWYTRAVEGGKEQARPRLEFLLEEAKPERKAENLARNFAECARFHDDKASTEPFQKHWARHDAEGRRLLALGDAERAAKELFAAACMAPDHSYSHWKFGQALERLGRNKDFALEAYDRALKADPNDERALYSKADVYFMAGHQRVALEHLATLLAKNPKHVTGLNLKGMCHAFLDEDAEAQRAFQEAVRVDPKHYPAWVNLGHALHPEKSAEALVAYEQASRLQPGNAAPWYYIARGALEVGDTKRHGEAARMLADMAEGRAPVSDERQREDARDRLAALRELEKKLAAPK